MRWCVGMRGRCMGIEPTSPRPAGKWLQAAGIKDRIMHRRHKHQRHLPPWHQRHNELIGGPSAPR